MFSPQSQRFWASSKFFFNFIFVYFAERTFLERCRRVVQLIRFSWLPPVAEVPAFEFTLFINTYHEGGEIRQSTKQLLVAVGNQSCSRNVSRRTSTFFEQMFRVEKMFVILFCSNIIGSWIDEYSLKIQDIQFKIFSSVLTYSVYIQFNKISNLISQKRIATLNLLRFTRVVLMNGKSKT